MKKGLFTVANGTIPPNGAFAYTPTDDKKITWKVKSNITGFPSFNDDYHGGRGTIDKDFYIVESIHRLAFNYGIEWPPRNRDRL